MACDNLHRVNIGGSNSLLFENCQWSDVAGTNLDITTIPCNEIQQWFDVANTPPEYLAAYAAKCIPTVADGVDENGVTAEEAQVTAEESNNKIKIIAFILIVLVIIGSIILSF